MISGKYPHQHKVTSNDPPIPKGMTNQEFQRSPLFQEGREVMTQHLRAAGTLPELLKKKGYRSLQTGKWWQGHYSKGGFTNGMTKGGRHGDSGLDIGRKTMEPIDSFLDECKKDKNPFFVWYAPMMPHDPHTPPDRLLEKYREKTNSIHVARYWAMIEWFDETVGHLLGALESRDLSENTIVVYLADNGWIQNTDGPRYAPKSKQSQFDGGLRTPILLRWPGKITPQYSDSLAQSIDIVPTLLAAIGLPVDTSLPGINLLDEKQRSGRIALFGTCYTHNAVDLNDPGRNVRWRWMIDGYSKLVVPNAANEPNDRLALYQLDVDPYETSNVAETQPERVRAMLSKLNQWWTPAEK